MRALYEYLDRDNLHHAYLIEGDRDLVEDEILSFLKECGVEGDSPDLCRISIDNFKIDEAFSLRAMERERAIGGRKFFVVSANNFSLDGQNTMLKMFEEPTENTHFFLVTPDANALLPTLLSRVYPIYTKGKNKNLKLAEAFIAYPLKARIDFIKELLVAPEDEVMEDSVRAKALQFLNDLELAIYERDDLKNPRLLKQIFKVREFLRMPGSSPKMLLESVALLL